MTTTNGSAPPSFKPRGVAPQTNVFSGSMYEPQELAAEWQDHVRWQTILDMQRDGKVREVHQARRMPLLQARWFLSPSPDESPISARLHNILFKRLNFRKAVKDITLAPRYGFMILERIHGVDSDGTIYWKSWSPRMPWTIPLDNVDNERGFIVDEFGELIGVRQREGMSISGERDPEMMPRETICILVHEQEGNDYTGTPLSRYMRKPYRFKDGLERIDAVAAERSAKNVPALTIPEDHKVGEDKIAEKMLKGISTNSRPGLLLKPGWQFMLHGTQGAIKETIQSILHHTGQIGATSLANALDFGSSKLATAGATVPVLNIFQLQTIGDSEDVCAEFQLAADQIVRWNEGTEIDPADMPKVMCETIAHRDFPEFTKAIALAKKHRLLTWTPYDEVNFREEGRLAALPEALLKDLERKMKNGEDPYGQEKGADPGQSTDGTGDGNEGSGGFDDGKDDDKES